MIECSVCHSKLVSPTSKTVSRAYDIHRSEISSKYHALNVLLVVGDCILVGLQPILVYMSKVDGSFKFSPVSVNFLTEVAKVFFAIIMLLFQARQRKAGEKSLLSISTFVQLYFNPATVKMLSNLKVLVIAVLLKIIMKRRFSIIQWEALALLLIGISVNQLRSLPEGTTALGLPVAMGAYIYTLIFDQVTGRMIGFAKERNGLYYLEEVGGSMDKEGPSSFDILKGHSKATMFLICNNAAQGILSSFFFKYADTILKKYSSTVATIFTGIASALLFGHTLTMNFMLGISIVFISMHQFFSPLAKAKNEVPNGTLEMMDAQDLRSKEASFINMTAGATEDASHLAGHDEKQPLLPT